MSICTGSLTRSVPCDQGKKSRASRERPSKPVSLQQARVAAPGDLPSGVLGRPVPLGRAGHPGDVNFEGPVWPAAMYEDAEMLSKSLLINADRAAEAWMMRS